MRLLLTTIIKRSTHILKPLKLRISRVIPTLPIIITTTRMPPVSIGLVVHIWVSVITTRGITDLPTVSDTVRITDGT